MAPKRVYLDNNNKKKWINEPTWPKIILYLWLNSIGQVEKIAEKIDDFFSFISNRSIDTNRNNNNNKRLNCWLLLTLATNISFTLIKRKNKDEKKGKNDDFKSFYIFDFISFFLSVIFSIIELLSTIIVNDWIVAKK